MDKTALIDLVKNHWKEFVELCGNEDSAENTLLNLQKEVAGYTGPDMFY